MPPRPAACRRLALAAALAPAVVAPATALAQADPFNLTLLHNNDGESQLLPIERPAGSGTLYAGAANFVTLVKQTRAAEQARGQSVVTLSSGDNILPGPEFNASRANNRFFDADVINAVGYDALTLGNHDFDFGPQTLAGVIGATDPGITFLSANLDFSAEPALQASLVDSGPYRPEQGRRLQRVRRGGRHADRARRRGRRDYPAAAANQQPRPRRPSTPSGRRFRPRSTA